MFSTEGFAMYSYVIPPTLPDQLSMATVTMPSPVVSEGSDKQTTSSSAALQEIY